jgi:Asp-tRNA(Asn)/Glu-tRNA(Gln) amidotransferase A subunit family amidase
MGQPGPLSRSIDDLELLWEVHPWPGSFRFRDRADRLASTIGPFARAAALRIDFDGATGPYNDYCWPYVGPFNASGHPSLVMPLGTSKDGLPIGVQLIGPYWSEPELLHIARQLAPLTNGFVAPQGF